MKIKDEYRSKFSNDTRRRILRRNTHWVCVKEGDKNNLYSRRIVLAGLAYLQYQQIAKINWDKLQSVSQGAISNLANATTQISNNLGNHDHTTATALANFGIPLTGSMATGFAVGFMKG
jgi:uncharacterized membrane protein (Fun14 family)